MAKKGKNNGKLLIGISYAITLASVFILIFKFFYPYHIVVAICVYFANWVIFFIGLGKATEKYKKWFKHHKELIGFTLLALVVIYFIYVLLPIGKIEFLGMSKSELEVKIELDWQNMNLYIDQFEDLMAQVEENKEIFEITDVYELTEEQRIFGIQLWANFVDYQVALNKLVDDYKYFYQINYFTNRELHAKAYLIGYAAFLTSYQNGVKLIGYAAENELLETILDDEYREYGVPAGMYTKLKWNVLHVNDMVWLTAGYGNYKFLYPQYEKMGLTAENPALFAHIEDSYKFSTQKMAKESIVWLPLNAINIFKERTYNVWFPIQKGVANAMGNTRLTTRHENFITESQIEEMQEKMEPGDILLERRNWYTSNIGIPGFWPHAAIYLGDLDAMKASFDAPEIEEYINKKESANIDEFLKGLNSSFYEKYSDGDWEVIEAVAEGVVLQPIMESAKADYVGVLRPKISKLEKFRALEKAIGHYGKNYDYHFDFITDSELVCTELVYKAYKPFIDIDLVSHIGKMILPGVELVKKFDSEYGTTNQELDFVYFLDGKEETAKAMISGIDAFRQSWQRSKWDFAQE